MIPEDWRPSVVHPILKSGKLPEPELSIRPISLASCVDMLIERLVHRQLMWLLEHHEDLPCELSGFRRVRSTADAVRDLIIDLDAAKSTADTAYAVFLDVCWAYDALLRRREGVRATSRREMLIRDHPRGAGTRSK